MTETYVLNKLKAIYTLMYEQHSVSLGALGLIVVLMKIESPYLDLESWMNEFGGGWSGWDKKLIHELVKQEVLIEVSR